MLYIIGGSPRGGKTTLAKKISKKIGVPYFSTDYLRLMMIPYFGGTEGEYKFPFEKMYNSGGILGLYENHSAQELLDADIQEALTLWNGIDAFISFLLEGHQDYILEGIHVLPQLIAKYKNLSEVKIIYLAKTDDKKIFEGLISNRGSGDWIADNIQDDALLKVASNSLAHYGEYFTSEAEKYGFTCIHTDNNFIETIEGACFMIIS